MYCCQPGRRTLTWVCGTVPALSLIGIDIRASCRHTSTKTYGAHLLFVTFLSLFAPRRATEDAYTIAARPVLSQGVERGVFGSVLSLILGSTPTRTAIRGPHRLVRCATTPQRGGEPE